MNESCDYNSMLFTSWTAMLMTERWGLLNEIEIIWHVVVTVLGFLFSMKDLHLSLSLPTVFLSPQPTIIARSPRSFLRSARSCLWPGWPVMVYFNSSGETDSGEPPHPSPPGQGCLHGQTLSGGRRGRCGRCWSRGSRIAVSAAGAWTAIAGWLVCSLLVCL